MISPREWRWVAMLSAVILLFTSAPYLLAYAGQPPDYVFNGLLLNPADGNSYFAKMQEGYRGEWLFTLPYSVEPGAGAFLFTFYLFLGHLACWLGLTIPFTFHAARVFGGALLLVTAYPFAARFTAGPRWRLALWLLVALGSGFGWMATLAGRFTSDLWVAEAIPFLSLYANPHFPLAQAAELWILMAAVPLPPIQDSASNAGQVENLPYSPPTRIRKFGAIGARRAAILLGATTALGLLLPFALLTTGLILAGWLLFNLLNGSRFTIHDSRFTIHDSRFTIHDSRFTIHDSRF
ncbi:MAG: hypothetical protein HY784_17955, partial [Chloroflexi bacterium]|nr:hypothetical protein [Chloroflexota bacterium]